MPKVKAVLFDLGNTLIYFNSSWPKIFSQADKAVFDYLNSKGFKLDKPSFIKEFRGRINANSKLREIELVEFTTAYLLRNLLTDYGYPTVKGEIIRETLSKMYQVSQAHWLLEDDCLPMLERLKSLGYRLGIISNASDDADVQKLVDNSQIRKYMDFTFSSAAIGLRKPDPRIFEIALAYLGNIKEEVVMVGDTLNADILGAKNFGIRNIWIKRRATVLKHMVNEKPLIPDNTIETLAELPNLIEKLNYLS